MVRAHFDDFDRFKDALRRLKESRVEGYTAYGPVSLEEVEDLMPQKGSAVRIWATAGALVGLIAFWFMCIKSALIYSLITTGKPPISNVPFVIVSYEGTILVGSVAAFLAVLALARLYPRKPPTDYDSRFSGDRFGIDVATPPDQGRVVGLMKESGAIEIDEE